MEEENETQEGFNSGKLIKMATLIRQCIYKPPSAEELQNEAYNTATQLFTQASITPGK